MGSTTSIQWAHSTVNPVMGCDGCELYPSLGKVRQTIGIVADAHGVPAKSIAGFVGQVTASGTQHVKLHLAEIARKVAAEIVLDQAEERAACERAIKAAVSSLYVCYASTLHRFFNASGDRPGYARAFDEPTMFMGRVGKASALPTPRRKEIADKPWLIGYQRLIFISDMGDALSRTVPFEFLLNEIIRPVTGPAGRRHIWLWLSKRPRRMAQFAVWLAERGIIWPENLVAMTTVTGPETVSRVRDLMDVPARFRGLSLEPLWDYVTVPLHGIDWVIVGGESGSGAMHFDISWARDLRDDCTEAGVSFFVKQLGRHPCDGGKQLEFVDKHGGDWAEWPQDLRVRQLPTAWQISAAAGCDQHQLNVC